MADLPMAGSLIAIRFPLVDHVPLSEMFWPGPMAANPTPPTLKVREMAVPVSAVAPSESLTKAHVPTSESGAALNGPAVQIRNRAGKRLATNFLQVVRTLRDGNVHLARLQRKRSTSRALSRRKSSLHD